MSSSGWSGTEASSFEGTGMALTVVGISHHTASVEIRERFAFGEEEGRWALVELKERSSVDEAVLLSTCNRTEMYLYPATEETLRLAESLLQRKAGALPAPVTEFLYRHWGADVPRHLFRVTSGLDSLVFGEAEIQGQVKSAYRSAVDRGSHDPLAGSVLNRLFQAIHVTSVRRAFCLMYKGHARAVRPDYTTYEWNRWVAITPRPSEEFLSTPSMQIQIPRVVLLTYLDRLPPHEVRFTRRNIYLRDRNRCQYCGGHFSSREAARPRLNQSASWDEPP